MGYPGTHEQTRQLLWESKLLLNVFSRPSRLAGPGTGRSGGFPFEPEPTATPCVECECPCPYAGRDSFARAGRPRTVAADAASGFFVRRQHAHVLRVKLRA